MCIRDSCNSLDSKPAEFLGERGASAASQPAAHHPAATGWEPAVASGTSQKMEADASCAQNVP
eukprot:6736953-Pyramimonas_sp.AAC.1